MILITLMIMGIMSIQYLRKNTYAQSNFALSILTSTESLAVNDFIIVSITASNLETDTIPEAGIEFDRRKLEYISITPGTMGDVTIGQLTSDEKMQRMVITGSAGYTGNHELAQVTLRIIDTTEEKDTQGKGSVQLCSLIDPNDYDHVTTTATPTPISRQPIDIPGNFDEADENRLFETINASRTVAGNTVRDGTFTSLNLPALVYNRSLHQAARKLAVALNQSETFEKCLTDTADSTTYTSQDPQSQYYWKLDPNGQWFDVQRNSEPYMHTDVDGGGLDERLSEFGYPNGYSIMKELVVCRPTNLSFWLPKWDIRSSRYTELAVAEIDNGKGYVVVFLFGKPN